MKTPYYLIYEHKLKENLEKIDYIRQKSGAKFVLALKCFSTWATFEYIRPFLDGTTSSSLYEAKLGYEEFGKEVHAYSAAFSEEEILELQKFAHKVIFNSVSQLKKFHHHLPDASLAVRVNPQVSYSSYDLANPARKYCRLGESNLEKVEQVIDLVDGLMLHYNCENGDFNNFCQVIDSIIDRHGYIFEQLKWLSLGGGISYTKGDYPLDEFSDKLKEISDRFSLQIYLEPGDAVITNTTNLVVEVLDIVHNEIDIAIVNSSAQAHMPDLLLYNESATIDLPKAGKHHYVIAGQSCLAGDIFGEFSFEKPLQIGDKIYIANAGGYTMVENNWFNGIKKPAIVIEKINGEHQLVKEFTYTDYKNCLS